MDEMQTLRQQRPRQVEACSIESQLGAGAPAYILKNTTARRYMKLSEEGLFLWQLIDGRQALGRWPSHVTAPRLPLRPRIRCSPRS
jgi:hypothetical protein